MKIEKGMMLVTILMLTLTYKGIIYGKDYIEIGDNENSIMTPGPRYFNFYGAMATKNKTHSFDPPTFFKPQPLSLFWPWGSGGGINTQIDFNTHVVHTLDGLDTLVPLRGQTFKIRKAFSEILK